MSAETASKARGRGRPANEPTSGPARLALSQGVINELCECADALENTTRLRFSAMDSASRIEQLMREQQHAVLGIAKRLRLLAE